MNTEQELVFPFNRSKIVTQMLTQALFIFMFGYLFKMFSKNPKGEEFLMLLISPIMITLMFSAFIFSLRKLFSKSPGLVINRTGIIDNTTGLATGIIPWGNINRMFITQHRSVQFLTIEVHDPEHYLQQGNILSRIFKRINHTFFRSPIHISAHTLVVLSSNRRCIILLDYPGG